jgi:hypothetical protein
MVVYSWTWNLEGTGMNAEEYREIVVSGSYRDNHSALRNF